MKPSRIFGPLLPLYASAIALKNAMYDHGLLRPQRLAWPVVSVGNLSVGGTGKTPFVGELARLLQQRGWSVDVLRRGHGRRSQQVEEVDPAGSVERYGDEPLLLAQSGWKVWVGRKRYDAGRLAETKTSAQNDAAFTAQRRLHLLDDGMQHRKLARTAEIVLLERGDLSDRLLPVGRLRESLQSLRRADICVLREEDSDRAAQVMEAMRTQDATRVWVQRRATTIETQAGGVEVRPQRAVAFCGLGNAAQFFFSLRQAEVLLAEEISYPDHHVYTDRDIDALVARAKTCDADAFVTTEKDRMRLQGSLRETLEVGAPLYLAKLSVTLMEPERCLTFLEALLDSRMDMR